VIGLLKRAAAEGHTIVIATHDPDLLELATTHVELTPKENASARAPHHRTRGTEPALTVRGLTKTYAGTPAVDDAYLDLRRGELGVLLGRSGSGKSTLLMAIGGWLTPDAGSVVISGVAAGAVPPWRDVSHLPQRFALLPELSVQENVELPLRLAHSRDDTGVTDLLERLALTELRDRAPNEISIGQQQRAALARALVRHPTVLIADEPTSHQDTASAELVWAALSTAARNGTACLVATHHETLGSRADRVWRIADGRISTASDSE
jgi:ABC-type lipoprotein export system ATPase subunit